MATYFGFDAPESDKRRKHAKTLTKLGMSPDHANLASILGVFTDDHDRQIYSRPAMKTISAQTLTEATAAHPSGKDARQTALVGWWMLIEPNTAAMGRMLTKKNYPYGAEVPLRPGTLPVVKTDEDGVFVLTWESPAEREQGLATTIEHYLDHHQLADESNRHNIFYGALDPVTAVPVRHVFRDGSAPVSAWVSADGTGRILAARAMLADVTSSWLSNHSWSNPRGVWDTSAAALRTFLAAASAQGEYEPMQLVHSFQLLHPRPGQNWDMDLNGWNMRAHQSPRTQQVFSDSEDDHRDVARSYTGAATTDEWLAEMDMLKGYLSPEDFADEGLSGQENTKDEVLSWLFDRSMESPQLAWLAQALIQQPGEDPGSVFFDVLTDDPRDQWIASQCRTITTVLREHFGASSFCDLYGIYGDLSGGEAYEPLLDRGSDWARVGAALGLMHAATLGLFGTTSGQYKDHFGSRTLARVLTDLMSTPRGWSQVCELAKAGARDLQRVPFVDGAGQVVPGEYLGASELAEMVA